MKRNIVILLVFAAAIMTWACFSNRPAQPSAQAQNAAPAQSVAPQLNAKKISTKICGISLQIHSGDKDWPTDKLLDEIASTTANTVCLVIHGYQENASSNSIFIDTRKTPSAGVLANAIRHAHMKGLRVMVMPVVLLSKRRGNEWRGQIAPASWDEWWNDYTAFILYYAQAAQSEGAEFFCVGSELITTETQTYRWAKLIGDVRNVYSGMLTYSANWDHYEVPAFWKDLDMVGMTTYYDLCGMSDPTMQTLLESWQKLQKNILAWQATVKKPIIFTEAGWPNQTTAAKFPWNYYKSPDQPDPQLQARCFKAFFDTWAQQQAVAGFLVWEWRYHPTVETSPEKDTSYCPAGKEAMNVINDYYRQLDGK